MGNFNISIFYTRLARPPFPHTMLCIIWVPLKLLVRHKFLYYFKLYIHEKNGVEVWFPIQILLLYQRVKCYFWIVLKIPLNRSNQKQSWKKASQKEKKIRKIKLFSHRYFTHFKCLAQRICIVYVFLSVGALLIEPHLRLTSIPHCLCGIYW